MTKEEIALQITLKYLETRQDSDVAFLPNPDPEDPNKWKESTGTILGNIYNDVLKVISND